LAQN